MEKNMNKDMREITSDKKDFLDDVAKYMPPFTKVRFWFFTGVGIFVCVLITLLSIFAITRNNWARNTFLNLTPDTVSSQSNPQTTTEGSLIEGSAIITETTTEAPTKTPTETPTETPTQVIIPTITPTVKVVPTLTTKRDINFLFPGGSSAYFKIPNDEHVFFIATDSQDQGIGNPTLHVIENITYQEIQILIWIKLSLIDTENSTLKVGTNDSCYLDNPNYPDVTKVQFLSQANGKLIKKTENIDGDYVQIIITGWLDVSAYKLTEGD